MNNTFVLNRRKVENMLVLRIANVLLLFPFKMHADHSERKYALLQYTNCMRSLDGIGKEIDSKFPSLIAAKNRNHSMRKD